ncbi:MAG: hypothetical protein ACYC5O_23015 [Anaerolineae bacterium]
MAPRLLRTVALAAFLVALAAAVPFSQVQAQGEVVIAEMQLLVVPFGDGLRVGEAASLSNRGTETYVGQSVAGVDVPVTVVYPLPADATDLRFDGAILGERFRTVSGGFADTSPVPAGEATLQARFSYDLPRQDGAVIDLTFPLDVELIGVLVVSEDVDVRGDGLTAQGWLDTEMGRTRVYSAGPLPAGSTLRLTTVRAGAVATVPDPAVEVAVGVAALAVAGVISYRLWQPARQAPPESVRDTVAEMARLDDAFRAAPGSRAQYRERRQALLERARAQLAEKAD